MSGLTSTSCVTIEGVRTRVVVVVTQPDRLPTCVRVFSPVFMVLEGRECTRPTHSVPVALEFAAVLCFRQLTTPFFMHPFMYHDTCNPCIPKCLHSTHTCMLYIVFYSVRFKLKTLKDGIVLRIDVYQVSWPTRVLWMCVRTPPCVIACINVCAHVKDPVVHVRVQWIMETLKHLACTEGWVVQLCQSLLSLRRATHISYGRNPQRTIQSKKEQNLK